MLEDKINADFKEAMKERNEIKVSILRMVKSSIQNLKIEKKKKELGDENMLGILAKHVKQAQDALEGFKKGGREDLIKKEAAELEIIKSYLPQEISSEELKNLIKEAIKTTGAASAADMGRVMKELMPKVKGRADGKKVNQLVQELLSGANNKK